MHGLIGEKDEHGRADIATLRPTPIAPMAMAFAVGVALVGALALVAAAAVGPTRTATAASTVLSERIGFWTFGCVRRLVSQTVLPARAAVAPGEPGS